MKNIADSESDGESVEIRAEYDFSGGVRGKYADRHARGTNVVRLDADVAEAEARKAASIAPRVEDPT
jgi:hypothetical protein